MSKTYLVTVGGGNGENTRGEIEHALSGSLPYGLHMISVERYDPENQTERDKIPAIKRIRELLYCSLLDAKFLADVAQEGRDSGWGGVSVTYNAVTGKFRVADNRS